MSYIRDDVSKKRKVGMVITYALLILFAILAIAPLLWLAINSFKTSQDYQMNRLGFPKEWFWQNYTQAWTRGHFGIYIINSIIYTAITTVAILALSFMSGFAFSKINNRNTKWIYGSYVVPASCLLNDFVASLDKIYLALPLIFDRTLDSLERSDVLHLRSRAEFLLASGPYGKIDVSAHGAFLHLAVGNSEVLHGIPELCKISRDFLGAPEIRL